jgi:putative SOS response-associated peptidase YedK
VEDIPWFGADYNVAPQTMQPVVRLNRDTGKREFALMRWGLVPYSAKQAKIGYSTINARAEEAATKPLFREALIGADASFRRALLTSGSRSTRRQRGRLPSPCKAASPTHLPASGSAGIRRSVARDLHHLTTDPHGLAERVPDRMPVILDPQDQSRWMGPADSGDPARPAVDLLRPYPAEQMRS